MPKGPHGSAGTSLFTEEPQCPSRDFLVTLYISRAPEQRQRFAKIFTSFGCCSYNFHYLQIQLQVFWVTFGWTFSLTLLRKISQDRSDEMESTYEYQF